MSVEWTDFLKETARFKTPFSDPESVEKSLGIVDGLRAAGAVVAVDALVACKALVERELH